AVDVHLHHHAICLGWGLVKHLLQDFDHEHHRRVIVVQQHDVIDLRLLLLGPRPRAFLDAAAGFFLAAAHSIDINRDYPFLMNVPSRSSLKACCSSSSVFITIGPYHATGSSIGLPDTRRNRIPSSPASTTTSSPRSKSTSDRLPVSPGVERTVPPPTCSVSTPCGSDASRNVPEPAKTYANALFVVSTCRRFLWPGGTDTSR